MKNRYMVCGRDLTLEIASRRLYDSLFMELYGFIKPASDGPLAASKLSALEKVAIEVLKKEHQIVPVYFTYGEALSDGEEKES